MSVKLDLRKVDNALIGYGGEWIECKVGHHVFTMAQHRHLAPFVVIHYGKAEFEDKFLCRDGILVSLEQMEAVFDWCTAKGVKFQDVFS